MSYCPKHRGLRAAYRMAHKQTRDELGPKPIVYMNGRFFPALFKRSRIWERHRAALYKTIKDADICINP